MRRNVIILLVIALIVLIVAGFFLTNPDQGRQALVELGLVEPEKSTYTASGFLSVASVTMSSMAGGRISDIGVAEGDLVEQGDILVEVDSSLYDPQLEAAKARLKKAQAELDLLRDRPDRHDLAVAKATEDLARVVWQAADQAVEEVEETAPEPVREKAIQRAKSEAEKALADYRAAQRSYEALANLDLASEIEAAEIALSLAELDIEDLEDQRDRLNLTAPISGWVLHQYLLPGELAAPGQPILEIADLKQLELTVYLPLADLNWASVGSQVGIRVDSFSERAFQGVITRISDRAEFTPRNVQTPEDRVILVYAVYIRVLNPTGELKPGLPADAIMEEPS
jgi:HlyD family secretion protein